MLVAKGVAALGGGSRAAAASIAAERISRRDKAAFLQAVKSAFEG